MPVASVYADTWLSMADLQQSLGGIPAERIRMAPPPGTATEDDLLAVNEPKNGLCELVDGTLVEKAMGWHESRVAVVLITLMENFLESHDLGFIFGSDSPFRVLSGKVRLPDVSFVSWDHFPDGEPPDAQILDFAPDLAVEVLSPSNTRSEMERKLSEFFAGGTQLVWIIDPRTKIAKAYTSPADFVALREKDELDGGAVLPGFRCSLRELFARAKRSRRN